MCISQLTSLNKDETALMISNDFLAPGSGQRDYLGLENLHTVHMHIYYLTLCSQLSFIYDYLLLWWTQILELAKGNN